MNVIAYLKSSNDEGKLDIETQSTIIQDYCEKNQINIVQQIYNDEEFDEILYGCINSQSVNALVVVNSGYITKDINIYFYYKACLLRKNINLISVQDEFEQFKEKSDTLNSFISCMLQMERENIMKRTSAGRAEKASRGGYSGGRAAYGYEVLGGKLLVKHPEADVVVTIFKLYEDGMVLKSIADKLNDEGYRTKSGTLFYPSTVKQILDNKLTYQGMYRYGKDGKWVKGEHEAILKDSK